MIETQTGIPGPDRIGIVFLRGNGPVDWAIRYYDKGYFNHVAMRYWDDTVWESVWHHGIRRIRYQDIRAAPRVTAAHTCWMRANPERTLEWWTTHEGKRYPKWHILLLILFYRLRIQPPETPGVAICSEAASRAAYTGGVDLRGERTFETATPESIWRALYENPSPVYAANLSAGRGGGVTGVCPRPSGLPL